MKTDIIWTLLILNSTLSTCFIHQTSPNHKRLSKSICKITKDIIRSKSDTQDVLIGNLDGPMWSSTVNDIAGCVGRDNAVVVSDFEVILTEKTLSKAAVIVLIFKGTVMSVIQKHRKSSVWHHMTKIIIIVQDQLSMSLRFENLHWFVNFGFLDVVCVHLDGNSNVQIEGYASLLQRPLYLTNIEDSALIFPDKLKNMEGFQYKVAIYQQIPRVIFHGNQVTAPLIYFLFALQTIQNATVEYLVMHNYTILPTYWVHRAMHLTLNTVVSMKTQEPKLMTYEENSYCCLVPILPEISLFKLIFVKPFDGLTWLCLVLTMACCIAVWWMFRNRGAVDSPWLLAYGMFVMFIGQGVEFSRKNRLVLAILLQLIVVMIWVLSQAYEGVITSFMIQPIQQNRLKTFNDVMSSKYEILTDEAFGYIIKNLDLPTEQSSRFNFSLDQVGDKILIEFTRQHFVIIAKCDQVEIIIDKTYTKEQKVSELYYLLPERIFSYFEQLEASYLNPFIERFQHYMDLSFQAGLPKFWKSVTLKESSDSSKLGYSSEPSYLELKDITQIFFVFMIACVLSGVVLLIEILFHDILKKLSLVNLARKLRNRVNQLAYKKQKQSRHPKYQKGALYYIIHRRKKIKRLKARKLKVRRIYVQPRFQMD